MPDVNSEEWIGEQPDLSQLELKRVGKQVDLVFFGLFSLISFGVLLAWWLEYMKGIYTLMVIGIGVAGLLRWKYHWILTLIAEDQKIKAEMKKTEEKND